jgi:hypothetical protein
MEMTTTTTTTMTRWTPLRIRRRVVVVVATDVVHRDVLVDVDLVVGRAEVW